MPKAENLCCTTYGGDKKGEAPRMKTNKQRKENSANFSAGRIAGGIFIISLAFQSSKGLYTMDWSHSIAIVIALMGVPICIMFFLLGFAMIFAGMPQKKKKRKVSAEKLK